MHCIRCFKFILFSFVPLLLFSWISMLNTANIFVQERVQVCCGLLIILLILCFQANITRTNHIMWTMGTDFKYQYANRWYQQMDKFIHYVNQVSPLQNHYKCSIKLEDKCKLFFFLIVPILFFQFGCRSTVYMKV